MPRLFDGSRSSIMLLGSAVSVLILMVFGSLVLSGQLPPRGLVTGDVRVGLGGRPVAGQPVIFERVNSPDAVTVRTDARGRFSATVPPGWYFVDMAITGCPRIGPCADHRQGFPVGTSAFTIAAGQHIELHLGTCDGSWQGCPGGLRAGALSQFAGAREAVPDARHRQDEEGV
jgi:hypothetical protein